MVKRASINSLGKMWQVHGHSSMRCLSPLLHPDIPFTIVSPSFFFCISFCFYYSAPLWQHYCKQNDYSQLNVLVPTTWQQFFAANPSIFPNDPQYIWMQIATSHFFHQGRARCFDSWHLAQAAWDFENMLIGCRPHCMSWSMHTTPPSVGAHGSFEILLFLWLESHEVQLSQF